MSSWGHFAPQVFSAILLTIRPPIPLRLVLSALASYHTYTLVAGHTTGGGPTHDYAAASAIGGRWAGMLVLSWLCDPMKDWRYEDEKVAPADYPFLKRFYYAACIVTSPRSLNWNVEVANVPPPKASGSRREFLRDRILRTAQCALMLDLAQSYINLQPSLAYLGTEAFPGGWRGFVLKFLCRLAWYVRSYTVMKLLSNLVSIFCVATGLFNGNPKDWRPMFGNWSDAYTVRRFWGRTWHQNLRRNFTITGRALSNALGFKRGTNASAYTQLYAGFALSGIMHVWGDIMLGAPYVGTSMKFFLANACAITLEDAVIAVGRRMFGYGREPTKSRLDSAGQQGSHTGVHAAYLCPWPIPH
ncbi:hypothetical protein FKP32DRAFT_1585720 [Trametes sanguinea]|nr:hypothetical protein FKP32DRAFT_1585720 [Trametes sanguinea]